MLGEISSSFAVIFSTFFLPNWVRNRKITIYRLVHLVPAITPIALNIWTHCPTMVSIDLTWQWIYSWLARSYIYAAGISCTYTYGTMYIVRTTIYTCKSKAYSSIDLCRNIRDSRWQILALFILEIWNFFPSNSGSPTLRRRKLLQQL